MMSELMLRAYLCVHVLCKVSRVMWVSCGNYAERIRIYVGDFLVDMVRSYLCK